MNSLCLQFKQCFKLIVVFDIKLGPSSVDRFADGDDDVEVDVEQCSDSETTTTTTRSRPPRTTSNNSRNTTNSPSDDERLTPEPVRLKNHTFNLTS